MAVAYPKERERERVRKRNKKSYFAGPGPQWTFAPSLNRLDNL